MTDELNGPQNPNLIDLVKSYRRTWNSKTAMEYG